MKLAACAVPLCVALAFLVAGAPADAARKPITGKLSKPNYTVIALAANGKAKAVRATRGKFRLRPLAGSVTLHLRAPTGRYAGPIVVGRGQRGKSAILGIRAGTRLGRVRVRRGYATVSKRPRKRWIDSRRRARARRGVPLGARAFGRVRSRPSGRSVRVDQDHDGVPNLLDIDDDGDLILDQVDRGTRASAAQEPEEPPEFQPDYFQAQSRLELGLPQTANANHPALAAQIDTALPTSGNLLLGLAASPLPAGAELDCGQAQPAGRFDPNVGGLVYCSSGGSGSVSGAPFPGPRGSQPFDADGDGLGAVIPGPAPPGSSGPPMTLFHRATSAQIGSGDLLMLRTRDRDRLFNLDFVHATSPALVSYRDGADPPNSATISYPVTSGPGTQLNGFPVAAGCKDVVVPCNPAVDVFVTLTFWRPQRRPIAPETGWIDIGGLGYGAQFAGLAPRCRQGDYSENDPELRPAAGEETAGLVDLAPDRPANSANKFTYTLNLTQCLVSNGSSLSPGETRGFGFFGGALRSITQQNVYFKRL